VAVSDGRGWSQRSIKAAPIGTTLELLYASRLNKPPVMQAVASQRATLRLAAATAVPCPPLAFAAGPGCCSCPGDRIERHRHSTTEAPDRDRKGTMPKQ